MDVDSDVEVSSVEEPLAGTLTPTKKITGNRKGSTKLKPESKSLEKDGEKEKDKGTYSLTGALKPGRTVQYSTQSLFQRINEGDIELNPEYQRGVVWSDNKQIHLIDSIFRNFYVPPVIFAMRTDEETQVERAICIDGKQRLTSIFKFMKGEIPHRDAITGERYWFRDNGSGPQRKNILPPSYTKMFELKQIVCIEYDSLTEEEEREVFQRVQLGVALTTAEKMQAITGPWSRFIRDIADKYYNEPEGISAYLDMDETRARDFQNLTRAIFCIDSLPAQIHGSHSQLEKWLSKEEGPTPETEHRIEDTFRIFKEIASNKTLRGKFLRGLPSRIAPAEFVMMAVCIARNKGRLSLAALAKALYTLRKETRKDGTEVRTNQKVFKKIFGILEGPVRDIKIEKGEVPAGIPMGAAKQGVKRTYDEYNEESDEDMEGDVKMREDKQDKRPNTRQTGKLDSTPSGGGGGGGGDLRSPTVSSRFSPSRSPSVQVKDSHPPPPPEPRFPLLEAAKIEAARLNDRQVIESVFKMPPAPVPTSTQPAANATPLGSRGNPDQDVTMADLSYLSSMLLNRSLASPTTNLPSIQTRNLFGVPSGPLSANSLVSPAVPDDARSQTSSRNAPSLRGYSQELDRDDSRNREGDRDRYSSFRDRDHEYKGREKDYRSMGYGRRGAERSKEEEYRASTSNYGSNSKDGYYRNDRYYDSSSRKDRR